ncbi:hypothetical protein PR048_002935 [Dryococelus australis]|uniref:Uncharacterized protein n=1 Tax=Dryococelus australis TaxID=614101 RepID=A0ABQ9ILM5_9NEOP|nr:hypothetical protein PR048_002935 [Dryococelus australis]
MEQRRNARTGEARDPRENSSTSGIVRHDSRIQKSGSCPTGNLTRRQANRTQSSGGLVTTPEHSRSDCLQHQPCSARITGPSVSRWSSMKYGPGGRGSSKLNYCTAQMLPQIGFHLGEPGATRVAEDIRVCRPALQYIRPLVHDDTPPLSDPLCRHRIERHRTRTSADVELNGQPPRLHDITRWRSSGPVSSRISDKKIVGSRCRVDPETNLSAANPRGPPRVRSRSEGAIRATLTRTSNASSLLRARSAVFSSSALASRTASASTGIIVIICLRYNERVRVPAVESTKAVISEATNTSHNERVRVPAVESTEAVISEATNTSHNERVRVPAVESTEAVISEATNTSHNERVRVPAVESTEAVISEATNTSHNERVRVPAVESTEAVISEATNTSHNERVRVPAVESTEAVISEATNTSHNTRPPRRWQWLESKWDHGPGGTLRESSCSRLDSRWSQAAIAPGLYRAAPDLDIFPGGGVSKQLGWLAKVTPSCAPARRLPALATCDHTPPVFMKFMRPRMRVWDHLKSGKILSEDAPEKSWAAHWRSVVPGPINSGT